MKLKFWLAILIGMLSVGTTAKIALAGEVLYANFDHRLVDPVHSGDIDYLYCTWTYLSGAPHDAWSVEISPVYDHFTLLDHWDGGGVHNPLTYGWFIEDTVRQGDSNPYDYYYGVPAPWLKVQYSANQVTTVTYTCKVSLHDHLFDIDQLPVYLKVLEATDSLTVTIWPESSGTSSLVMSSLSYLKPHKYSAPKIRDLSKYKNLALTNGGTTVINVLKKNKALVDSIDFIVLEYNEKENAWIISGYKYSDHHSKSLIFKSMQKSIGGG
ncbi:hypothetical protein [Thermococcus stetteri]|uniref:hypothetical protein n=1 Tax=Thermococcus stetteri TaxID=49900 RepID=UPI001AEA6A80|nr:hypothetical protein [Thermococcus stetteri]MBP1911948.1 hypothetical protein [Thermococcus stetteri]